MLRLLWFLAYEWGLRCLFTSRFSLQICVSILKMCFTSVWLPIPKTLWASMLMASSCWPCRESQNLQTDGHQSCSTRVSLLISLCFKSIFLDTSSTPWAVLFALICKLIFCWIPIIFGAHRKHISPLQSTWLKVLLYCRELCYGADMKNNL